MLDISKRLLYYKRREVQTAIVNSAIQREVGIRYGVGFGKRPDAILYENDVMQAMKKGATSFHISEERWSNPMQISKEMKKNEFDDLRSGWDLVIDIDCPFWLYSKLSAYLFVRALELHGITSIGCKFSGNKGFHIGVPFEVFPEEINGVELKNWFPEGPKRIALYLIEYITQNLITINGEKIIFEKAHSTTLQEIMKTTQKSRDDLCMTQCVSCKREKKEQVEQKTEYLCLKCGHKQSKVNEEKFQVCSKCKSFMKKIEPGPVTCVCGSTEYKEIFDPLSIIDVDTILISSRHLYRAPYSMHEKSGLISLPIHKEKVMSFEKREADPALLQEPLMEFLPQVENQEGTTLIVQAFDYVPRQQEKSSSYSGKKYELPEEAIGEEFFPPSIQKGLLGLEDGKKRFLFILINFLKTAGWNDPKIEERIWEWNKQNPDPLKEVYVKGQLRHARMQKKIVPPPNYASGYYRDLGIDEDPMISRKYKNPIMYAKIVSEKKKKKKGPRLTDEQKAMRKKYRDQKKAEKKAKEKALKEQQQQEKKELESKE